MENTDKNKHVKRLRALAVVNSAIWAISIIVFVVLLQTGGNIKGLYVILAAGTVVSIQLFPVAAKLKVSNRL